VSTNLQLRVDAQLAPLRRPALWSLVFVVVLYGAIRWWRLSAFDLWGGEAFSVYGVRQGWSALFSYVINDVVHPPLFYILLKIWVMIGGEDLLWLKLFPVMTAIATLPLFILLCAELNLRASEMILAMFLAAANGYLVHYSQELRMYALFQCLTVLSLWLFVRYFNAQGKLERDWWVLLAVNLMLVYTHYYGWLVVGVEFLTILLWNRHKWVATAWLLIVLLVCFAPWAYVVTQHALQIGGLGLNLDWIQRPSVRSIGYLYANLNGSPTTGMKKIGLVLFGAPLLVLAWRTLRSRLGMSRGYLPVATWLGLTAFVPVFAVFVASRFLTRATWIDRYFIFTAIPYLMLVSVAVHQLPAGVLRYAAAVAIMVWAAAAGIMDVRTNRMAWESPQLGSRLGWSAITRQLISAERDTSDKLTVYALPVMSKGQLTGDWAITTSIQFYSDLYGEDAVDFHYARRVDSLLSQVQGTHFWIAYFELGESRWEQISVNLTENGYRIGCPIVDEHGNNRLVLLPVWHE
jgi:hypothetical protein